MSASPSGLDGVISTLSSLKRSVETEETRRDQLRAENERVGASLARAREELDDLQSQAKRARLSLPESRGDEVLRLDVGGRTFKTYRSTLSVFPDSVLAAMVNATWAEGARQEDGTVFLDMDPETFSEILAFLRRRRVDKTTPSAFKRAAAELALYLGVPVDYEIGARAFVMKAAYDGGQYRRNLAFDVATDDSATGSLHVMTIDMASSAEGVIFMKSGTFEGFLSERAAWNEVWRGTVTRGRNRLVFDPPVKLRSKVGIYMHFQGDATQGLLLCGIQQPRVEILAPRTGQQTDPETAKVYGLTCMQGRGIGLRIFNDSVANLSGAPRYFAGEIEYTATLL